MGPIRGDMDNAVNRVPVGTDQRFRVRAGFNVRGPSRSGLVVVIAIGTGRGLRDHGNREQDVHAQNEPDHSRFAMDRERERI